MREMVWFNWCDMCFAESGEKESAPNIYTVGVVAGEARPALKVLELCDVHNKVITELMDVLQETGQTPELKSAGTKATVKAPAASIAPAATTQVPRTPCPVCSVMIARNTIITHVWSQHREDDRPPIPTVCPECRMHIESGTGMSAHRRTVHGYSALDEALSGVKGYQP